MNIINFSEISKRQFQDIMNSYDECLISALCEYFAVNYHALHNTNKFSEIYKILYKDSLFIYKLATLYKDNFPDKVINEIDITDTEIILKHVTKLSLKSAIERLIYNGMFDYMVHLCSDEHKEFAIKVDSQNFKLIKNPTVSMQLLAVERDYTLIKYMENPPEIVQLKAIYINPNAIHIIKNPCLNAFLKVLDYDVQILQDDFTNIPNIIIENIAKSDKWEYIFDIIHITLSASVIRTLAYKIEKIDHATRLYYSQKCPDDIKVFLLMKFGLE